MRLVGKKNENAVPEMEMSAAWDSLVEVPVTYKSYHELLDRPVVETDALTQLEHNVLLLEELQNRLSFVMREVRYLMKV